MATAVTLHPIPAPEGVPKYSGPSAYDGPTPGWLMENHKLAHQIIACHSIEPMQILDASSLAFLRRYVENPAGKEDLLKQFDMVDKEGDKLGTRANKKYGSLVGYAIASGAFDEGEVGLLKEWFGSGVVDEELKGVEVTKEVMPGWNGD